MKQLNHEDQMVVACLGKVMKLENLHDPEMRQAYKDAVKMVEAQNKLEEEQTQKIRNRHFWNKKG